MQLHRIGKTLSAIILTLTVISGFSLTKFSHADFVKNCAARDYDHGKLWEIKKDNGPKSYIFGTMHSKDSRILHLPGVVMQALKQSNVFMMETTLSQKAMVQIQAMMLAPVGTNMNTILGPKRIQQLEPIAAEYNMPIESIQRLKIWATASILSQPPSSRMQKGEQLKLLDRELEKLASAQGKVIVALEQATDQLNIFDELSTAAQLELLDSALKNHAELDAEIEKLTQYYLRGETGWFFCNMEDDLKAASPEIQNFVLNKLIIDRNHHMAEGIMAQAASAPGFVAIGALHLPGAQGVLKLLEMEGFSIRRRF